MTAPREPWSDERLAAAFARRAGEVGHPPAGLSDAAVSRVTADGRRQQGRMTWSGPFAAAAATVVIVAAVVGLSRTRVPSTASQPPSVVTSIGATGEASAVRPSPTRSAVVLEPIDVSEALRIRNSVHDGRELAVTGYLSPTPQLFCPAAPAEQNPTALFCPNGFRWLLERPEHTLTLGRESTIVPPSGPAFHPSFALVTAPVVAIPESGPAEPLPVTVVGHFDDRRAALCPTSGFGAPAAPCRDTFVVDQVRSVGGNDRPVATTENLDTSGGRSPAPPTLTDATVDAIVRRVDPDLIVLSRYVTTATRLSVIEPGLPVLASLTIPEKVVWEVTALDSRGGGPWFVRTLLLPGNGSGVFEVAAAGVTNISPSPPLPEPSSGQSPGAS